MLRADGVEIERFDPNLSWATYDNRHFTPLAFRNFPLHIGTVLRNHLQVAIHSIAGRVSVQCEHAGIFTNMNPGSSAIQPLGADGRIISVV